jgi:hypothetical protein
MLVDQRQLFVQPVYNEPSRLSVAHTKVFFD